MNRLILITLIVALLTTPGQGGVDILKSSLDYTPVITEVCYNPTTFIKDDSLTQSDIYKDGKLFNKINAFQYIEIYNSCPDTIDIRDYSIKYSKNGTDFYKNSYIFEDDKCGIIKPNDTCILLIYNGNSNKLNFGYADKAEMGEFWAAFESIFCVKIPSQNRAIIPYALSGTDTPIEGAFQLSDKDSSAILRLEKSKNTFTQVKYDATYSNVDGTAYHFDINGNFLGQAGCSPSLIRQMQTGISLPPATGDKIKMITFNIAYSEKLGKNNVTLDTRAPYLFSVLNEYDADIIALQEVNSTWYGKIKEAMTDYTMVGVSGYGNKDGNGKSALDFYNLILFKKDTFTLLDSGNFWLSASPDVPSSESWNDTDAPGDEPRVVTWVKLRHKDSGKVFMHFNTHFVYWNERGFKTRTYSVDFLKTKLPEMAKGLPFFLSGDFNTKEGFPQYITLQNSGFTDSKYLARETQLLGTTNGFVKNGGQKKATIDYIWKYGDKIDVQKYKVIDDMVNDTCLSDHNGIYIEAYLK